MPSDTGIMKFDKTSQGRWVHAAKDGRDRQVCVISNDQPGVDSDESYVGYWYDLKKADIACNLAISFSGKEIRIQAVKPGSKDVKFLSMTPGEFMDKLELLMPVVEAMAK
jgi:hypothetical protein